jgi:hypothetical protein
MSDPPDENAIFLDDVYAFALGTGQNDERCT